MKPSLFLAAVEATAKTVRTLLTTPQLKRPFREPFTPECMRGETWLAYREAEEEVLAPWWSAEAVKARARVETPLSATFTDEPPAEDDTCPHLFFQGACLWCGLCDTPQTPGAVSATAVSGEDPPRGAEEAPRGADSDWNASAIPAIQEVLAQHRVIENGANVWCEGPRVGGGLPWIHANFHDAQEWREHVAPLIAKAVRGAL